MDFLPPAAVLGAPKAERRRRFVRTVERDADLSEQPIAG